MKIKTCLADLAINGGSPAFSEQLHVGRPNIGNRDAFIALSNQMLDRAWLTNGGPLVQEFERRVADYLGVRHVVAMCNGTIALEIAVRAVGLTGEVILPSYTFVATAHSVYWQGLTPVFVDIDPRTHCLDPDAVRRAITPRTTGIIAVHLWGNCAPIRELEQICSEYDLDLICDAAHAFGCSHGNKMIGGNGRCEVFSFHATKFLNSFEGGAVTTNDDKLADAIRLMRNFGFAGYDNVIYPGTNGKMVESCAAMGIVNIDSIDKFLECNRRNHEAYVEGLAEIEGLRVMTFDSQRHNWQYVVVEVDEKFGPTRDQIIAALHAENVLARRYFWPGAHRMKPYRDLYPWCDLLLPQTLAVADRVIVLPTGTAVSTDSVKIICSIFRTLSNQ